MLLGAELHVHIDRKHLTFNNLQTQRILCWQTYGKEYSPEIHYVPGPGNVVTDTFSRLGIQVDAQVLVGKNANIDVINTGTQSVYSILDGPS